MKYRLLFEAPRPKPGNAHSTPADREVSPQQAPQIRITDTW